VTRHAIRYTPTKGLMLRVFGALQRWAYVDVRGDTVRVRMSYGFSTRFSRRDIAHVSHEKPVWVTAGVHGWRGRWLVNGASRPIVSIKLHEPVRARVLGVAVRLREVQVSVEDANALIAELR
jgi:hypothetical protein